MTRTVSNRFRVVNRASAVPNGRFDVRIWLKDRADHLRSVVPVTPPGPLDERRRARCTDLGFGALSHHQVLLGGKETFRTPRPRYEPVEWTQTPAHIARAEGVDLIVPVHEGTEILANTIKRYPDLFPDGCKLFFSDFDLEARLENKYEFQAALKTLGMPTLDFALVRSQEELEALDFDLPFALKRAYSRASQDVYKVCPGELPRGLSFEAENPWIAQEWANGTNYCSYSVCHNGHVKAHALYPVRYAIEGTSCLMYESVEHEGIAAWVRECVKAFNFTGQMGFDFIDVPGCQWTAETARGRT